MKKGQKSQKSQKRTKFLFILIMLTAILAITATYAWFSTQRDVEIVGMKLNVEVAESLQISLDGKTWVQSIEIENMRQFYGTWHDETTHQAYTSGDGKGNTNYVPTELLPVSSDGTVTDGILQFVQGTIIGKKLTSISKCNETSIVDTNTVAQKEGDAQINNKNHPYLVFDMYLRNVSAKEFDPDDTYDEDELDGVKDVLILNTGSHVWADTTTEGTEEGTSTANTGLEYSARVGFILYGETVAITQGDDPTNGTVDEQVRGIDPDGSEKVAIWEPNDKNHTQYVKDNDSRITALEQAFDTLPVKSTVTADIADVTDGTDTTNLAVTLDPGDDEGSTDDDTYVASVKTMKPSYQLEESTNNNGTTTDTSDDIVTPAGTNATAEITHIDGTKMRLMPNTMSKVRVYIWLEGQDPDCVDLASTGGKLDIDIKLTKNTTTVTKPSYTGDGS